MLTKQNDKRSPGARSRLILLAGGGAVVVLLIAVWFGVRGGRGRRPVVAADTNAPPGQGDAPRVRERGAFTPGGPVTPQARSAPAEAATGFQQRAQLALDEYRRFALYPPWSRPADAAQVHTINWNAPVPGGPVELAAPAGRKKANDDPGDAARKEPPILAELTLDRMFAGPGESLVATVRVWRQGDGGTREPVDAKIDGAIELWADEKKAWTSAAPARFVDASEAGAKQARIVPSSVPALADAAADVHIVAHVKAAGRSIDLAAPFRFSPAAPVVVHGITDSRIRDGSLDVDLDLDVRLAGPLRIEAVLAAEDGRPIAVYADFKRPDPGRQTITITFFGRVISEAAVDGPYRIISLHGFVSTNGNHSEVFWSAPASYPTPAYRASDFSSAEWSSPEKDAKIRQYEGLIQR